MSRCPNSVSASGLVGLERRVLHVGRQRGDKNRVSQCIAAVVAVVATMVVVVVVAAATTPAREEVVVTGGVVCRMEGLVGGREGG